MTSLKTPSTLKRTVTSLAWGSMWMSEAPSPIACCRMEVTRRIIGFSSGPASMPRSSSVSSYAPAPAASSRIFVICSPVANTLACVFRISSSVATTGVI
jgi:hypothetical protein